MTETIWKPASISINFLLVASPGVRLAALDRLDTLPKPALRPVTTVPAPQNGHGERCCHSRPLCRCAHAEWHSEEALEQRIWIVLSLCGGVVILYAVWCFFWDR